MVRPSTDATHFAKIKCTVWISRGQHKNEPLAHSAVTDEQRVLREWEKQVLVLM